MPVTFVEEYGSFQIESTPNKPFLEDFEELNNVIRDMRHRRKVTFYRIRITLDLPHFIMVYYFTSHPISLFERFIS